mmetsp:Transcript_40827/g.127345  ORF Transcript_40827/g.127345 Transcript_40827/m.127345 type:complete len:226 (-) Transcript_40827:410-1087(-)
MAWSSLLRAPSRRVVIACRRNASICSSWSASRKRPLCAAWASDSTRAAFIPSRSSRSRCRGARRPAAAGAPGSTVLPACFAILASCCCLRISCSCPPDTPLDRVALACRRRALLCASWHARSKLPDFAASRKELRRTARTAVMSSCSASCSASGSSCVMRWKRSFTTSRAVLPSFAAAPTDVDVGALAGALLRMAFRARSCRASRFICPIAVKSPPLRRPLHSVL